MNRTTWGFGLLLPNVESAVLERQRGRTERNTIIYAIATYTEYTHAVYVSMVLKELHALNWMRIIFSVNLPSLSLSVLYSVYETLYAHINTDCAQANKFIRWKSLITNTARGEQKAKRKKQTLNGPKMYRYTFAIHNVKYTTHIARCTVHTYIQYLQSWSTDVQKNCTHVKYVISE